MGWVGPAKWAKISPRKGWVGLISAQHIIFFLWAEPSPDIWAGPELDLPKRGG
jgi:hypothetical protein